MAVSPEPFLPRHATPADLAAWCAVLSEGQAEASGGSPPAAALAERLLAEDGPPVPRWAARATAGGPVVGVAELRPRPHDPRTGFLRLFVAPPSRRQGVGAALRTRVAADARAAGMERLQGLAPAGGPGEPFALTWPGMRVLLRLERQEQRLDEEVLRRCRELAVCPDPGGYRPAHWVGPAPADGGPAADQHDTAVLPRHRRRGLARWIKAEQTLLLRERFPGVDTVTSTVNGSNLPMTTVNQAVGYRRVGERLLVEVPLTHLAADSPGGPATPGGP
ncbi:GNAT family N-acetyltransferase [Sphaerisporangium corydalis]|uniref:GNAT family N-acetyltransferase n=1 Tax=Sphaerisporangium corydalis TaxID=1441875 RepID=A0ABV9EHH9_9ACTN|nr:GNAT family N-acetyltransferase [Sphaerisporangium corydalis]